MLCAQKNKCRKKNANEGCDKFFQSHCGKLIEISPTSTTMGSIFLLDIRPASVTDNAPAPVNNDTYSIKY